jgi:hypothetical protein
MCEQMAADADRPTDQAVLLIVASQWRTLANHAADAQEAIRQCRTETDDPAALRGLPPATRQ